MDEEYFLGSLESKMLEEPRKCTYKRKIKFWSGKEAVIAHIDKDIQWQDNNGQYHVTDKVILTARQKGYGIFNIRAFPVFVYVTVLRDKDYNKVKRISKKDLIIINIGELYETFDNAKNHTFY